jgi:dephospho-CoA kinase
MPCRLCIGLTGGIASGKTQASRRFASHGVPVIDTDLIARELVEPGQAALAEIIAGFGKSIIGTDGELDRSRLRSIVFSDPSRRRQLEHILHPRIRERALSMMENLNAPYCLVVIPLLVESATDYPLNRILVVDTPPEQQVERLRARDGISDPEIQAILRAQATRTTRLQAADDVLVNDGNLKQLHSKVDALHRYYLHLASVESS